MTGKSKYAEQMAKHLNEPIEAACPITRPGGTTAQIAGGVGGVAGALIAGRAKTGPSDVQIGQFAWLGVAPDHFAITKSSMMGKPTGDPLARVAFDEVTAAAVTETKLTLRVDLDLNDGRHIAFEAKRQGPTSRAWRSSSCCASAAPGPEQRWRAKAARPSTSRPRRRRRGWSPGC